MLISVYIKAASCDGVFAHFRTTLANVKRLPLPSESCLRRRKCVNAWLLYVASKLCIVCDITCIESYVWYM